MKEAIKKNKKIIIIAIAIIVLLLIGVAFAYLTTTLHGEKENLVRAGSLGLRLEEGNELTLVGDTLIYLVNKSPAVTFLVITRLVYNSSFLTLYF